MMPRSPADLTAAVKALAATRPEPEVVRKDVLRLMVRALLANGFGEAMDQIDKLLGERMPR